MEYTEMAEAEGTGDRFYGAPATWDEMQVRDALLELKALEAEAHRIDDLANQIVDRYMLRKRKLVQRADAIRESVRNYITERNGGEKIAFPDVGTAYLTTRKAKIKVADPELFESEALNHLVETGAVYDQTFNAKRALELVLDELGLTVTTTGELVTSTGEIFDLNGVEVTPEGKTLAVRGA